MVIANSPLMVFASIKQPPMIILVEYIPIKMRKKSISLKYIFVALKDLLQFHVGLYYLLFLYHMVIQYLTFIHYLSCDCMRNSTGVAFISSFS